MVRPASRGDPNGLCQNRDEIARADRSIFGGTFVGFSQGRPAVYRGDALWDPSAPVGAIDRSRPGSRRADIDQEDRGAVVTTVGAPLVMDGGDGAGGGAGRPGGGLGDAPDLGSHGPQQEVRQEDGVLGSNPGRKRKGVGLGVLDDQRDRGWDTADLSSLRPVVLSPGAGTSERERGDRAGDRNGCGADRRPWGVGGRPGRRPGGTFSISVRWEASFYRSAEREPRVGGRGSPEERGGGGRLLFDALSGDASGQERSRPVAADVRMPAGQAPGSGREPDLGRGPRLRRGAAVPAHEPRRLSEPQVTLAGRGRLYSPLEGRGSHPLHQAELSAGGHSSPDLSKTPEHDRPGDGGRLLRIGLSGRETEVTCFISTRAEGGSACLRHPGLPLYALADGIKHCLFSRSPGARGLSSFSPPSSASPAFQLPLFDS